MFALILSGTTPARASSQACDEHLGFTLEHADRRVVTATHHAAEALIEFDARPGLLAEVVYALEPHQIVKSTDHAEWPVAATFFDPEDAHHLREVVDLELAWFVDDLAIGRAFTLTRADRGVVITARLDLGHFWPGRERPIYTLDVPDGPATQANIRHQRTADFEWSAPGDRVILRTANKRTLLSLLRRASRSIVPKVKPSTAETPRQRHARRAASPAPPASGQVDAADPVAGFSTESARGR